MLKKKDLDKIIILSIKEVLENPDNVDLESFFTGPKSVIESIDIVQIISFVEEKLEEKGFEGFDLLEKVFEYETLKFSDFSTLIEKELNT